MVADHITFTPLGQLANGVGVAHWGTTYSFDLQARYDLFDQHNRALVGTVPIFVPTRRWAWA
jgi:hypothetical protein